jgi:hypothetical protein
LAFIPLSDGYRYVPAHQLEKMEAERPTLVLYGSCYLSWEKPSDYTKRFLNIGLETILFVNMAYHPQYSGKKLSTYSADPYSILTLHKSNAHFISKWANFYKKFIYHYNVAKK